jgi:hypothetical protein
MNSTGGDPSLIPMLFDPARLPAIVALVLPLSGDKRIGSEPCIPCCIGAAPHPITRLCMDLLGHYSQKRVYGAILNGIKLFQTT